MILSHNQVKRWTLVLFLTLLCSVGWPVAESRGKGLEDIRFLVEELPPYTHLENGQFAGVSYEVLKAALNAVGTPLDKWKVETFPWARIYDSIQHEPNTCAFTTRRTEEREQLFKWAGPIVDFQMVFIAKKGRFSINSLTDVKNYTVGVQKFSGMRDYLLEIGVPSRNIIESLSPELVVRKFAHDRCDLLMGDERATYYALKQGGVTADELESFYLFNPEGGWVAFNKKVPDEVVATLQKGLDIIRANGTLGKILYKFRARQ
ncbi:transporter substrate-binding domain-containing protein [Pseudodesulfovibrio sp. zrk46]|uniref:substrate-binding periplasmic protein n=1 Tax=Pseudodesulfovibrio sp. zrk46 TaxID=2725288 RepID=UPI00144A19AD|nr:transporter substrate-binding domain-containing protein [Pseudodesulfovibrio sp. zrk46]QJB55038.1 amino acid ABC transporter substrate-binding protein [Pseudodesulfovibrio sp. zrk46]